MNENKNSPTPQNNGLRFFYLLISGLIFAMLINSLFPYVSENQKVQISYNQFMQLVESENVKEVQIDAEELSMTLRENYDSAKVKEIFGSDKTSAELDKIISGSRIYYTGAVDNPDLVSFLRSHNVEFFQPIVRSNPISNFVLNWILPMMIFFGLAQFAMSRMSGSNGLSNIGKSNVKVYNIEKSTGVTFKDVAGQDEAKESLTEIVDFLHHPEKYTEIGAKQPKGALLVGPPGTGKTLIAKAVAGEAKVPFFSLSGSEFVEMFVGVGASRVRDLFAQAAKSAPCIIFIDEIDAIGKSRDNQFGGNDEREQTLNQLLAEMDGFDSSKGVVVLAATNRPETLDKALLRPGRFDRRIIVDKPDLSGREEILKVHAAKVRMGGNIDLRQIAFLTSGASGADLANIINEAALRAVRMDRSDVMQEDLMEAVESIIAGKERKDRILNVKEKKLVSYHEVGHALASALQKNAQPVQKITIVPRSMGALGYTLQMPEEERFLMTKDEILAQITVLLSGRAAEEVMLQTESTGASNDIERATQMARSMVTQYGMSEKFGMMGLESIQNRYLDGRSVLTCSEATGAQIDEQVHGIIDECHKKAIQIMEDNKEVLQEISEYLYSKETISGKEFMDMLERSESDTE